ncbi:MAG TPA: transposase [Burkholderiales bacterium]|nr:transposase [Burkholderiales bacterium]
MPRPARLIVPDIAVHVVQRGNDGADCFRETGDYMLYLLHLRQLSEESGCALHAYCLMTNHVHLLLTPAAHESCSNLMRDLGQRYVQSFNRRHGRTGTLWEGRFHSSVVESARYVLACYRYIESNPVRARMVNHPTEYAWSSYWANAGIRADSLLSAHEEYLALAAGGMERIKAYTALFENPLDGGLTQSIREAVNNGHPLASESFKATLAASTGRTLEPKRPGRPRKGDGNAARAAGKSGSDPDLSSGNKSGSDPDLFSEGGVS